MAVREKLFGILETTWHIFHDIKAVSGYKCSAGAAWNSDKIPDNSLAGRLALAHHTRHIDWDMKVFEYHHTGWCQYQLTDGEYPNPEF